MEIEDFLRGKDGHLRSGWRALFFAAVFLVAWQLLAAAAGVITWSTAGIRTGILATVWPFLIGAMVLLSAATLIGWACGAIFEELKFRALGWSLHRGWLRDLLYGSLIGTASLLVAAGIAAVSGGIRFSFNPVPATTISETIVVSLIVFVIAGAAEETLFRGYALQTFVRVRLVWVGVVLTALAFAVAHLGNPNVSRTFTFVNTTLAGVWLAVAYLRTRSLWFPLGLHWAWNWTQAALLGIPVSGRIDQLAPAPLLRAVNAGPDWLTGGAYGIEGGVACTVALIGSTIVIWRTKLVSTAEDVSTLPETVASAAATQ